jgi:hypothetical protein
MSLLRNIFLLVSVLLLAMASLAQSGTASLKGQVTDPTGAVITGASVTLTGAGGTKLSTVSDKQGNYELHGLTAGSYTLQAASKGFAVFKAADLSLAAGEHKQFDISLEIGATEQVVKVEETTEQVDVSPTNNAGATVLKGKDLDVLSDDPDEMEADLEALAGPSVGPNGAQIYIDGFTNGQLPPKNAIREIRINQNPFSAQFDRLGFGRVEIFTKPGMDQYHGQFQVIDNDSVFNSIAKFAPANLPSYQTEQFSGNVSGPVNKKASFAFNFERRNINDVSLIDTSDVPTGYGLDTRTSLEKPQRRTNLSPRLDLQITPNNTLTARYQFMENSQQNNGVGTYTLASQATRSDSNENMLQFSDSQVIGANIVNETRWQLLRDRSRTDPAYTYANQEQLYANAAVSVPGAFYGGGSTSGVTESHSISTELQNYTSVIHGNHFFRFGGRLRTTSLLNNQFGGANGAFTYASVNAFTTTMDGLAADNTALEIYNAGGGAKQYTVNTCLNGGSCAVYSNNYVDLGLYAEDDWKIMPSLTLSAGARYETQNDLGEHKDIAPRIGLAWGINKRKGVPTTVLRSGFGLFYDRVSQSSWMNTQRYNGVNGQASYTINCSEALPCVPDATSATGLLGYDSFSALTALTSTTGTKLAVPSVYQYDGNMRAPYNIQSAFTVEQQVTSNAKVTANYMFSRGVHQRDAVNINPVDPETGTRPLANSTLGEDNIFRYQTEGMYKMQMLMLNGQAKINNRLSLFGFFAMNKSHGDNGPSYNTNYQNLRDDWGHVSWMPPRMGMIFGTIQGPWGLRLNPMISVQSAGYYNITVSSDLNGDGIYNDRPSFTSSTTACTTSTPATTACYIDTPYGRLNPHPQTGEKIIPYNLGRGNGQFMMNMRLSKTFGLGPKLKQSGGNSGSGGSGGPGGRRGGPAGGPGAGFAAMFAPSTVDRKYSLTFSLNVRNLLNNVNLANPNGILDPSIPFGKVNALAGGWGGTTAANRKIEMQVQFSF